MPLPPQRFPDRRSAGRFLADKLEQYANRRDVLILALPRGGVPVGVEVARALNVPLDIFLVRKLGVPGHPELAMGAIASGGIRVLSQDLIDELGIPPTLVEEVAAREHVELQRRDRLYRRDRPTPGIKNRVVILVDDGLATGSTMEAAVSALRQQGPAKIVVAAPVGADETCQRIRSVADDVVCAVAPQSFLAVGMWYERFDQVSDDEVIEMLSEERFVNPGV
jgi:putative phosphoribosyl transferase